MTRKTSTILCGLAGLLLSAVSHANTITVDNFGDLGNGCTLRNAIVASADKSTVGTCVAGSGTDTIQLAAGTYALSHSLTISSAVTLLGAPTTNNGNVNPLTGLSPTRTLPTTTITLASGVSDRMFIVTGSSGGASFTDLYLKGGNPTAAGDIYQNNGGAIWSASTLNFDNVHFLNNVAPGQGGALFFSGQGTGVSAGNTSFENNQSGSGASALGTTCYSASAAESHSLNINQSLFYGNTGKTGSGYIAPALQTCGDLTVTVTNSTFGFNDIGIQLVGLGTKLVSVNSASMTLTNVTILGQNSTGIDVYNAVALNTFGINDSVIAFNGNGSAHSNCYGQQTLSNGSNTGFTLVENETGNNCDFTDGYPTTNSSTFQTQHSSSLDGTASSANFAAQFYLINPSNPGQAVPPNYGGLVGGYFPIPGASSVLVNNARDDCESTDQRGAPRDTDARGCTVGAIEPKKLVPVQDSGSNSASNGAARTAIVNVLNNDVGDEDGSGPDGTRYTVARVYAFDPSSCTNLNGGTIGVSADGTQIIYQPARPLVTVNGQQVPGPGTVTTQDVVCPYYIADNKVPANISQTSANVTISVADIVPVAADITYVRPYNGNAFYFDPLTVDSDPDGMNGALPPPGVPRANNISTPLTSVDCSVRQLVNITTQPTLGTVTGTVMAQAVSASVLTIYYGGNLTYQTSNSFSPFGDSFQYNVLDADCQPSNTATVTINTNAPPDGGKGGSFDSFMLAGGLTLLLLRRRLAR